MTETAISEEAAPQFAGDEINGGTGGGSAEDVGKARPRTTSPEDDPGGLQGYPMRNQRYDCLNIHTYTD